LLRNQRMQGRPNVKANGVILSSSAVRLCEWQKKNPIKVAVTVMWNLVCSLNYSDIAKFYASRFRVTKMWQNNFCTWVNKLQNRHLWPIISECTGPTFIKFSTARIIILISVLRSLKGRCYGDHWPITFEHCHARPVHIERRVASSLWLHHYTELRPLLLLSAWSIFCMLDTSITSQISHQIRPQMSSAIHDLDHQL